MGRWNKADQRRYQTTRVKFGRAKLQRPPHPCCQSQTLPPGNFLCSFKKCRLLALPPKLLCNVNWKQLFCSPCPLPMIKRPLLHTLCKRLWKQELCFVSGCRWHRADFHAPPNCAGDLEENLWKAQLTYHWLYLRNHVSWLETFCLCP